MYIEYTKRLLTASNPHCGMILWRINRRHHIHSAIIRHQHRVHHTIESSGTVVVFVLESSFTAVVFVQVLECCSLCTA